MLLHHPDYFGRVVAWDSALAMSDPSTGYGYLNILGSRANFENYRVTSLLQARASELRNQPTRLFLRGYSYDYTRSDHATVDRLITRWESRTTTAMASIDVTSGIAAGCRKLSICFSLDRGVLGPRRRNRRGQAISCRQSPPGDRAGRPQLRCSASVAPVQTTASQCRCASI